MFLENEFTDPEIRWTQLKILLTKQEAAQQSAQRTAETCEYCDTPVNSPNFAYHFCTGRKAANKSC